MALGEIRIVLLFSIGVCLCVRVADESVRKNVRSKSSGCPLCYSLRPPCCEQRRAIRSELWGAPSHLTPMEDLQHAYRPDVDTEG